MPKLEKKSHTNPLIILIGIFIALLGLDILFVMLFSSEITSYKLTQNELAILDQDRRIISASTQISQTYKNEILTISDVFPSESSFPIFIQALESILKQNADEYQFKFSSAPMAEGDKLFLLMTISVKTNLPKLISILSQFEHLTYMTHITGINAKTPGNFNGGSDYSIGLKVYVKNPFTTK